MNELSATQCKLARKVLSEDHRRPFVAPAAAPLSPGTPPDLYSIGVCNGDLYLKFLSAPKTLFTFKAVPTALIEELQHSDAEDRMDYFTDCVKDKFEFEVVLAPQKK